MPERIVIVGASIAGLATALALSHAGREIVVLERDAAPPEGSSHQVFETWERSGVPQLRHSHGFLARLRNLVRDRYPDLHVALLQAGAQERDLAHSLPPILAPSYTPHPRDDDLTTLLCRRTTFERVLDHYVRQQPGVRVVTGVRATGVLTASGTSLPHLTGITASRAETSIAFAADTVIDATGRRSPFPAWLRALGAAVEEETEDTGII